MTYAELIAGWFIFIGTFTLLGLLVEMATDHYRHWKTRWQIRRRVQMFLRDNDMPANWYDNDRKDYHI